MKVINNILESQSNVTFEPTLSLFEKAIVINYKKVGTRFLRELSSYPNNIHTDNKQIDIQFKRYQFKECNGMNELSYLIKNNYVWTPWDFEDNYNLTDTYKNWNNLSDFLNSEKSENFTKLLLNNENKDIVFLVRNPIDRFFSGLIQVLAAYIDVLKIDKTERELLKKLKNVSDSDIDKFIELFNLYTIDEFVESHLHIYISFLIEAKWNLILQDIHTENYLNNYIELIHNISDKTKIKIIDLEDCNSDSAGEFFSSLQPNVDLNQFWNNRNQKIESNKHLYNNVIKIIENTQPEVIFHFLKKEYANYLELKTSNFFVKI
jgi:hypothetical protein